MSAQHTPGPWFWDEEPGMDCNLVGANGEKVLSWYEYEGMGFSIFDKDTDAANARLIAAAPDLLEAQETACSALVFADGLLAGSGSSSVVIDVAIEETRAAIAKAKGGAA